MEPLRKLADSLDQKAWKRLRRPTRYEIKTELRRRPSNVKDEIVRSREFETIRLQSEDVAEFDYRPSACANAYRMIVVRKNLTKEKGHDVLFPEIRYFFYITNDRQSSPNTIVLLANNRCDQEKLFAQLKSELPALRAPVDNLESNWAYMVIASLAWTLKSWFALIIPISPRWKEKHRQERWEVMRMGFHRFIDAFILVPAQVLRRGRQLIYKLLSWNPWQYTFLRTLHRIQQLT
jgi:hypothetical protein